MADIAVKGGWVVAWGKEGHQVLDGGVVVIEGDRIVFVGFPDDADCPSADHVIDAGDKLISPGLINLHAIANLDLQVLRMDGKDGVSYPKPRSYVMNPDTPHILTDEDFRTSAEFSVATLLKGGSTTYASVTTSASKRWEESIEPYALAEASERMGARAWLGHFYQEGCSYTEPDGTTRIIWDSQRGQVAMDHGIGLVKHLQKRGNPLLTGFLFPVRTDRCSDDMLRETMRQSRLLGDVHVRSHFSEYLSEYQEFKTRNPSRSMVEWLKDVGFLGPQVCLTHVMYVAGQSSTGDPPGDDLDILSSTGTNVCHCPVVFARGGTALESFSRYVAAGINMGIGTDTFPPDMIEEMRIGALINKVVDRSRSAGAVRDFYNAATIGGAMALGREDLGRLAPGCTADISIFDLSDLSTGPIDDPMRTLIHFANASNCETVMVGGKVVVEGGHVVGVDEEELGHRAQEIWLKYKNGIVSWDPATRPTEGIFPPLLPIVRR